MGIVHEAKYGPIEIPKETQENEPCFLIRGQDALAPLALESYARLLMAHAAASADIAEIGRFLAMARTVRTQAESMRDWQAAESHEVRLPD